MNWTGTKWNRVDITCLLMLYSYILLTIQLAWVKWTTDVLRPFTVQKQGLVLQALWQPIPFFSINSIFHLLLHYKTVIRLDGRLCLGNLNVLLLTVLHCVLCIVSRWPSLATFANYLPPQLAQIDLSMLTCWSQSINQSTNTLIHVSLVFPLVCFPVHWYTVTWRSLSNEHGV